MSNVLDRQENREAAKRNGSFSSFPAPGGDQLLCRELLARLEQGFGDREREAAMWLRLMLEHDASVQEIARLRRCSEAAVRSLVALGIKRLRLILRQGGVAAP